MKHKIILTLLTLTLVLLSLTSCGCNHVFTDASCLSPKSCIKCGYITGSALGHDYTELSCASFQTCKRCGELSGVSKQHDYAEATCTSPKKCTACGITSGYPVAHTYADATYTSPQTCIICGYETGDKLKLSDSCDELLSSGYDDNGDVYEIVANESESYSGVFLEIGIIKNNSWLLPLTNDMPLIDEDGTIFGSNITSIYDKDKITFLYIGNGCFLYEGVSNITWNGSFGTNNIIYNCETQDYFIKEFTHSDKRRICLTYGCIPNRDDKLNYNVMNRLDIENSVLITDFSYYDDVGTIEILDTNSMTSSEIKVYMPNEWRINTKYVYPFSDGLFAISDKYNGIVFYNVNGEQILQLNYKLLSTDQNVVFVDGKCTLDVLNNNDTPFTITIDKSGNVLTSFEKNQ